MSVPPIESLLSARLFLSPQPVGERLYFLSNLSGRLSLYAMDLGGSVPEPLLPPDIALQNPELLDGYPFYVFPTLGMIVVMIDRDGDENYQPMAVPIDGGIPKPLFGDTFARYRVRLLHPDGARNIAYLNAESRDEQRFDAYQARLDGMTLRKLGESKWGLYVAGTNEEHTAALLVDGYTFGDSLLHLWRAGDADGPTLLYGTPLEERAPGQEVPLTGFSDGHITAGDRGALLRTSLFDDAYGLGYLPLDGSHAPELEPVEVVGAVHEGVGELVSLEYLRDGGDGGADGEGDRYAVGYNIDGCSWLYEGAFDEAARRMTLDRVVCGRAPLANGVLEAARYDRAGDRYALSFSTATSPTGLYTVEGADRATVVRHTRERILGIAPGSLSPGEDASFASFDGLRVSARLYLPAPSLGYEGPRPLVYYIHGGPQGQERPDFAWFSMPLIQFLTLNGFAVFVPNARGSTGYGLAYMKRVDRDWGGDDRRDHVWAMERVLPRDPRIDVSRAGVVGRSYGGYMTLTLAARHPALWSAAVDMFGPYDLVRFQECIPETWKPYFAIALGDPIKDRDFLVERSPSTYVDDIACPLLVIQGRNDPRVVEKESRALVERLRDEGKDVEYLMFPDEGHDILKLANRVRCYNGIAAFFARYLHPETAGR